MTDLEHLVRRGLEETLGAEAAADPVKGLVRFAELLERWAGRINLTGHRDAEAILRRLVLDAVALWRALPGARSVADLGSGAGLPGFPIAILAPETRVLLVEARLRRHHFQRAVRRELALGNVTLQRGRIEELPPDPCDLAIAQAVAAPPIVLNWIRHWARPGGWVAIPGVDESRSPVGDLPDPDFEEARVVRYRTPLEGRERFVWLARRAV